MALCECGCGRETKIATRTYTKQGIFKGQPLRFIKGHSGCSLSGEDNPNWKGGKYKSNGYVFVQQPDHPRADCHGYIAEHVLIAEAALGHYLPDGAEVHHANGTRDSGPLVVCQDTAYHMLIECRTRALKACGHADWRKCWICQRYDEVKNMSKHERSYFHLTCNAQNERERQLPLDGQDRAA